MQIRHVLQQKGRDIVAISPTATLEDAVQLLAKKRIGAVLVKNGASLAGILSERDVVRAIAAEGASALGRDVTAYMTKSVATCGETDTVEDLMEMMTRGRFRHVPVLDEQQSVCGLISIGDVVKTRIAETVNEANSLRDVYFRHRLKELSPCAFPDRNLVSRSAFFLARASRSNAMKSLNLLAVSGFALSAFLIAAPAMAQQDNSYPTPSGDRVDANGMPTTHSTPAEAAQTAGLNDQAAATADQSMTQTKQRRRAISAAAAAISAATATEPAGTAGLSGAEGGLCRRHRAL